MEQCISSSHMTWILQHRSDFTAPINNIHPIISSMWVAIVIVSLLSLTAASPIVQQDVLDTLVPTRSSVSNPGQVPQFPQTNTLDQSAILPQVPTLSTVTEIPLATNVVTQMENQTQPHSSSQSESSDQSESCETPTASSPENTSENTASEEPDSPEETSESQETTSEDTTSEETASPLEIQMRLQSDWNGETRDDSRGSEENMRRNWIPIYSIFRRRQMAPMDILGEAVTNVPVTESVSRTGPGSVTDTVTKTVAVDVTVGVTAQTDLGVTEAAVVGTDSAASQSVESQEEDAPPLQLTGCRETTDNGECVADGLALDVGDNPNGPFDGLM